MRILFAVDGSVYSAYAARFIASVAAANGVKPELEILNVQKPASMLVPEIKRKNAPEAYSRKADRAFESVRRILGAKGIEGTEKVLFGDPAQVIAEETWDFRPDVIVMGSRGLTDFEKLFIGSVTTGVLARSTVPVLMIRSDRLPPVEGMKVLIAVDGSPYSEAAARYVTSHSDSFGKDPEFTLVTAVDVYSALSGLYPDDVPLPEIPDEFATAEKNMAEINKLKPGLLKKGLEEAMATIRPIFEMAKLPVKEAAIEGDAGAAIARYAKQTGADLVIMGTRGRSNFASAVLGSVTSRVAADGTVPLLVIPA